MFPRRFSQLSWLALALPIGLLLLVQYRFWFDDTGVLASKALEHKIAQLEQDNDVHQAENTFLLTEVHELRSGTELLEEKAREELGLIKAGEGFILFAEDAK